MQARTVSKTIKRRYGFDVKLVKAYNCWCFEGDVADKFKDKTVRVYRLNQLSLEQWLFMFEGKLRQNEIPYKEFGKRTWINNPDN